MSTERSKYEAECGACGVKGFCIDSSDDWCRTSTTWVGFVNKAPDPTAVARMRVSPGGSSPVCACGSKNVEKGKYLGECDWKGELYPGQAPGVATD